MSCPNTLEHTHSVLSPPLPKLDSSSSLAQGFRRRMAMEIEEEVIEE
jgi:hypothetical protein